MLILFGCIVGLLTIPFLNSLIDGHFEEDKKFLFGGVAVTLVLFSLVFSGLFNPTYQAEKEELVQLNGSSQINGYSFLGSGVINKSEYYIFYKKLPTGGFKQGKIAAQCVTIYEDTVSTGYIIYHKKIHSTLDKVMVFASSELLSAEIHIPPDSIVRSFKLE